MIIMQSQLLILIDFTSKLTLILIDFTSKIVETHNQDQALRIKYTSITIV